LRLVFLAIIVPSLLFILGCKRDDTAASQETRPPARVQQSLPDSFVLTDIDARKTTLTLRHDLLHLSRVAQPTVLLHFFSTRADLCRAMLPYLSTLQRDHAKRLFVLGIVVPESINATSLRTYMRRNDATFFISHAQDNRLLAQKCVSMLKLDTNYPLPLTILFDHGHYITHYEGITPVEMIRNDLNDLERNGQ